MTLDAATVDELAQATPAVVATWVLIAAQPDDLGALAQADDLAPEVEAAIWVAERLGPNRGRRSCRVCGHYGLACRCGHDESCHYAHGHPNGRGTPPCSASCPSCAAPAGHPCKRPSGHKAARQHADRYRLTELTDGWACPGWVVGPGEACARPDCSALAADHRHAGYLGDPEVDPSSPDELLAAIGRAAAVIDGATAERDRLLAAARTAGIPLRTIAGAAGMTHPGVLARLNRQEHPQP